MKPGLASVALLAAGSAAAPFELQRRQQQTQTSNEMLEGACKDVIFIFARGSIEPGNMGTVIGPAVCTSLKAKLGADKVACQGVGGAYVASFLDNAMPKYTSDAAINEAKKMFQQAAQKCPNAKIVFGGYSQGGAVMHGAVSTLDAPTKNKLAAGVLFGDSMNGRNNGKIPNYPPERILELCNDGDGICARTLAGITGAHMTYGLDGSPTKAVDFMAKAVQGDLAPIPASMDKPSTISSSGGGGLSSLFSGLLGGLGL